MRSSKSRSRGKSNRNRSNNPGNVINRVFDSSGPEGKVRGTPQQIIDKYLQLARDAVLGNDRVAAENFRQHAEHYARLLGEATREAEARRVQAEQQNRERQERERAEREARAAAAQAREADKAAAVAEDPSEQAQPDLAIAPIEEPGAEDNAGLVETPENKPKRRPRARKPKARDSEAAAPSADSPEAAG